MADDVVDAEPAPRASGRAWLALAVLTLPTMLTMLDISVLFLALPHLSVDLGASATQQLWITDSYGFLIAGFLVTMGTLGDRLGRRKVLLFGAGAFGTISVVAAFSSSPQMLIVCRALLGVAGATIMPCTLALIMVLFANPRQRGAAIAVWASSLTAGVALGPVVGGVLLQWFWWGSVFLIAVPVMLVVLIAGPVLLPGSTTPGTGRLDPLSVLLSLAAILPFVYGLKELARAGWSATPAVSIVVGVSIGVVFVLRQRRLTSPLLDLRLFAVRAISGALVLGLLVAAIQSGTGYFVAQHLQLVKGLSPAQTGLWILLPTVVLVIGIFASQGLAQRVRPAYVLAAGTVFAALGMIVLTQVTPATGLATLLIGFTIVYLGVSPVGPLAGQLVVPSAPPDKAGSASRLQATSGELGVALGIALLGSVGMASYRAELTVPDEIAATAAGETANESLPGALQVAETLPRPIGDRLVDAATEAFTSGLNVVAVVGVIVFAGLAALAVVTLRQIPPMAPPQPRTEVVEEAPTPVV